MTSMINDLAQLCFSEQRSLNNLHSNLLLELQSFLTGGGYNVIREYPIKFNTIRRRTLKEYVKHGYIDLYAEKRNRSLLYYTSPEMKNIAPSSIAIEFDSGNLLKYKSIEKLLQCGAKICIGIVRGSNEHINLTSRNIERISEIKDQYDVKPKDFYLIIINNKVFFRWP